MGAVQLARVAGAVDLIHELLRLDLHAVRVVGQVDRARRAGRGRLQQVEELVALLVGGLEPRREVAVVVAERLLLARGHAALYAEDEHDDDDHADADRDTAPHPEGLRVDSRSAWRRPAGSCSPGSVF